MLFSGGILWSKLESGVCHWPPNPLPRTRDVASHRARRPGTRRPRREREPNKERRACFCHRLKVSFLSRFCTVIMKFWVLLSSNPVEAHLHLRGEIH